MNKNLSHKMAAEFLGSFALVFFGCSAIALAQLPGNTTLLADIPWIFGLTISLMIYAVGHISGAHFNPAVTLAFATVGRFPRGEVFVYWVAQFSGAILAALLISYFLPEAKSLGTTLSTLTSLKALFLETLLAFFLMLVIISVATDSRAIGIMAGAAIGITVTTCAFIGGPLTGASMNPARSFGPALIAGQFQDLWIYFIGPPLGACCAAFVYEWIRCETRDSQTPTQAKGCC